MGKHRLFTRRQQEAVAEVLAWQFRHDNDISILSLGKLVQSFANKFAQDNPSFDRWIWREYFLSRIRNLNNIEKLFFNEACPAEKKKRAKVISNQLVTTKE